jgi:hypothetical protein
MANDVAKVFGKKKQICGDVLRRACVVASEALGARALANPKLVGSRYLARLQTLGALIISTSWFVAFSAWAGPTPELVVPVDKTTEAKLRGSSNYELRQQLYTAKRFALVRINFDALDIPRGEISFVAATGFGGRADVH